MTRLFAHVRTVLTGIVTPPSPSLLDAVFNGVHSDPATPTADHGLAMKPGTRIDRLRSHRRDLAAALRAGAGQPDRELASWPPASAKVKRCRA